jgi:hypothetical protein
VTVRLLPLPPHTPPSVEAHETKLNSGEGRLSVTTTLLAVTVALWFLTVIV